MITDKHLLENYNVNRQDAASLFLFLAFMPVGEEYKTIIGRIRKDTEVTFTLVIDGETIDEVASEFMEQHYEVRPDVFKEKS